MVGFENLVQWKIICHPPANFDGGQKIKLAMAVYERCVENSAGKSGIREIVLGFRRWRYDITGLVCEDEIFGFEMSP